MQQRVLVRLLMMIFVCTAAFAAPCGTGTISFADALTMGTCEDGMYLNEYTDYSSVSSGGALAMPASVVNTVFTGMGHEFFSTWVAGAHQSIEIQLGYTVTALGGHTINGYRLDITGVTHNDAHIDVSKDLCVGGLFASTGCTGTEVTLLAYMHGGSSLLSDQKGFAPATSVAIRETIRIQGNAGLATLWTVSNTSAVNPVPEVGTMLLFSSGFGVLALLRRRFQ